MRLFKLILEPDFEQPEQYGCLGSIGCIGHDLNELRFSDDLMI